MTLAIRQMVIALVLMLILHLSQTTFLIQWYVCIGMQGVVL